MMRRIHSVRDIRTPVVSCILGPIRILDVDPQASEWSPADQPFNVKVYCRGLAQCQHQAIRFTAWGINTPRKTDPSVSNHSWLLSLVGSVVEFRAARIKLAHRDYQDFGRWVVTLDFSRGGDIFVVNDPQVTNLIPEALIDPDVPPMPPVAIPPAPATVHPQSHGVSFQGQNVPASSAAPLQSSLGPQTASLDGHVVGVQQGQVVHAAAATYMQPPHQLAQSQIAAPLPHVHAQPQLITFLQLLQGALTQAHGVGGLTPLTAPTQAPTSAPTQSDHVESRATPQKRCRDEEPTPTPAPTPSPTPTSSSGLLPPPVGPMTPLPLVAQSLLGGLFDEKDGEETI